MAIADDVCVETAFDHDDDRPVKSFTTDKRPLHRIAEVRRQQGVSVRSAARRMGTSMEYIRTSELPNVDMKLSELYHWQQALDVPIADLLVDLDAPISSPVLARARMLKVMKTVKAIGEATTNPSIGRMVTMLEEQLCEIMPELKDVSAWHSVGQRRTQDEMGRIAERPVSDNFARDAMG